MAEMYKVRAVEGRVMGFDPREQRRGYVGYRDALPGETADHVIPCLDKEGKSADKRLVRLRKPEFERVQAAVFYRCAFKDGDLEQVAEDESEDDDSAEQETHSGSEG